MQLPGASYVQPVKSAAAEGSHVLKASSGYLAWLTTTIGATSGWLMLFDAAAAPVDGAVTPAYWFPVNSNGTNGALALSFDPWLPFGTGIVAVFSSTGPFNKTVSNTAGFIGGVQ